MWILTWNKYFSGRRIRNNEEKGREVEKWHEPIFSNWKALKKFLPTLGGSQRHINIPQPSPIRSGEVAAFPVSSVLLYKPHAPAPSAFPVLCSSSPMTPKSLTSSVVGHLASSLQARDRCRQAVTDSGCWMGTHTFITESPAYCLFPWILEEGGMVGGMIQVGICRIKHPGICVSCHTLFFMRGVYRGFPSQHVKTVFYYGNITHI